MAPGMRLISKLCREKLDALEHLVRDSDDLIKKISKLKIPDGACFIKLDISDFYMSGKHEWLTDLVFDEITCEHWPQMKDLLLSILRSQYVSLSRTDSRVWQVMLGAGMGMLAAGDIADLAYFSCVEQCCLLSNNTKHEFGIYGYYRFKDDALLICDRKIDRLMSLMAEIRDRSKFVVVNVESISSQEMPMLDVFFYKGDRYLCSSVLDYELYVKKTSQWQPLSNLSTHTKSIHFHWPLAQTRKIKNRFSDLCAAGGAIKSFQRKYVDALGVEFPKRKSSRGQATNRVSWIVIPFRDAWSRCKFGLCNFVIPPILQDKYNSVSVSWSLGGKHLIHKLRNRSVS